MMRRIIGLFLFATCVAFVISLVCLILITTRKNEVVVISPTQPPPLPDEPIFMTLFSASDDLSIEDMHNGTVLLNLTSRNISLLSLNSSILSIVQMQNGSFAFSLNNTCSCPANVNETRIVTNNVTINQNVSLISLNSRVQINQLQNGSFTIDLVNGTCQTVVCGNSSGDTCSCVNQTNYITNNHTVYQNTTIQQNVSIIGGTGIYVEQLSNGTFQINNTDVWFNTSMPNDVFTMENSTVNNHETMQVDFKEQEQQTFFAGPTANSGAKKRSMQKPAFRTLEFSDLPALPANYIWLGNQTVALQVQANSGLTIVSNATFGTIGMLQYLQTATPSANTFLAGNGTGATYRTLQTSDLPNINHDQLQNYVALQHVDHSTVSITAGFGLLGGGTIASSRTLSLDLNALPKPNMTNATGLLPIALGGTNSPAALNNNRIMVSQAGAIVEAGALANGQLLVGSTGAAPVVSSITAGNAMQVTNGAGSITVAYNHKENVAATTAPAITDSTSNGYSIGSLWINTATNTPYICTDATTGAAVWRSMLLPYSDLVQADDTIACSTSSMILATGMTLTPPVGTYLVTFAVGGLTHATLDASISISIYMGGGIASATMLWWRGGLAAAVAGTATALAKVTVNGSQAIEGRWSSSTSTANMRGRSLAVIQTS